MRGSPLVRAALAFFVILLLGLPLRELTGGAGTGAAAPAPKAPAATSTPAGEVELQMTFTTVPSSVRVLSLGKEVWSDLSPSGEIDGRFRIAYPKEGVDLRFQVEYPENAPLAAARVRLTDPEGETHEKALWGTGRVDDVLTFP